LKDHKLIKEHILSFYKDHYFEPMKGLSSYDANVTFIYDIIHILVYESDNST